jgi:hypothetical protein
MTDTSTRSPSAYVLGRADAELQRLAEQAALYGDLTEDAFRWAGIVMAIATQEFRSGPSADPGSVCRDAAIPRGGREGWGSPRRRGTRSPSKGARVKFSDEKRLVTDGPFAEAKEVIAGFSIIQAKSLEAAIEWVRRAPNVSPTGEGTVEIRKLMDVEDFGEEFTPNAEIAKVKY